MSTPDVNRETDRDSGATETTQGSVGEQKNGGFIRSVKLPTAIAINMTQMCGIGPFITIPPMVAAFGGPQAILGIIAFLLWARFVEHTWPFGPKEIKEEYLEKPVEEEVMA